MYLPIPKLDDKSWEEIVNEARSLIPRHARQWTDHNVHDPGITFIELFAWLAEIQNYRLDQVTGQHCRTFLKLLGLRQQGVRPARAEIGFEAPAGEGFLVPSGSRITAFGKTVASPQGDPTQKEEIAFEAESDLFLSANQLTAVITRSGDRTVDQSEANARKAIDFAPLGAAAPLGSRLELRFRKWFREPRFHLAFRLFEDDLPPAAQHAGEDSSIVPSPQLKWEYRLDSGQWQEIGIREDTTAGLNRSGRIEFLAPQAPAVANAFNLRCRLAGGFFEIPPRLIDVRLNVIPARQVRTASEVLGISAGVPNESFQLARLPVLEQPPEQAPDLKAGDVLDWDDFLLSLLAENPSKVVLRVLSRLGSSARAAIDNLTTQLASNDVKAGQTQLEIIAALNLLLRDEKLYDPQAFAGFLIPKDIKRVIERGEGAMSRLDLRRLNRFLLGLAFPGLLAVSDLVIEVGDEGGREGIWQRVEDFSRSGPQDKHYRFDPEDGLVEFGNGLNGRFPAEGQAVVARYYRHSLGAGGNLPAGQRWTLDLKSAGGLRGENLQAVSGGQAAETIEDAMSRARRDFRQRLRAVNADDYVSLALATPGLRVARARAIANSHPAFPELEAPGNLTVVAVPHAREGQRPLPGNGFLDTVEQHLERHRLITNQIHLIPPRYVRISVSCRLHLRKRTDPESVKQSALQALVRFLDPIRGGPDRKGWPFGRPVHPGEIYQLLDAVEGVDHVKQVRLLGEPDGQPDAARWTRGLVALPPDGLTCSGQHDLLWARHDGREIEQTKGDEDGKGGRR